MVNAIPELMGKKTAVIVYFSNGMGLWKNQFGLLRELLNVAAESLDQQFGPQCHLLASLSAAYINRAARSHEDRPSCYEI